MMEDVCDLKYSSASCNCSSHVLTLLSSTRLCYAANLSVNVCEFSSESASWNLIDSFQGHSDIITCIRNCEYSGNCDYFLTSSCDKTINFWNYIKRPVKILTLEGHNDAITVFDVICLSNDNNKLNVASASNDNTLKIWNLSECAGYSTCCQTIESKSFVLDIKFQYLSNCLFLFVGADDNLIHIYFKNSHGSFDKSTCLKGHEDWVRCLDFSIIDSKILLASGSQDNLVRIWNIDCNTVAGNENDIVTDVSITRCIIEEQNLMVKISLETILSCHESWITGVHWAEMTREGSREQGLFTSSFDKTIIFWSCSGPEIWSEVFRVGEVGTTTGGYYGCVFDENRHLLLANSYSGAIYCWKYEEDTSVWSIKNGISGHKGEVNSIDWDKRGLYLLSVGWDETTRLHAPWVKDGKDLGWYELARPQVHGHPISTVASVSSSKFVTGSEEKILRSFQAPVMFFENFSRLSSKLESEGDIRVYGATLKSLGLTNQAIYDLEANDNSPNKKSSEYPEPQFKPVTLTEAPSEDVLQQSTLWPEIHKLYGHGNEMYYVTCNSDGTLLASTCKAANKDSAVIIIWKTSDWSILDKLSQHVLTVTQLKFSPSGQFLLSVSRDRTWAVFKLKNDGSGFSVLCSSGKHPDVTRIIWSCDWTSDSKYFVTGSRDKKLLIWSLCEDGENPAQLCSRFIAEDSITSVSVSPLKTESSHILACGHENGHIALLIFKCDTEELKLLYTLPLNLAHYMTVTALKWKPVCQQGNTEKKLTLASCSQDSYVKIYSINLNVLESLQK